MKKNHWCMWMLVPAIACLVVAKRSQPVVHAASPAVQGMTVLKVITSPQGLPLIEDTQQTVLAPDGSSVNSLGGAISDEHGSVFPPGALGVNTGYLFFVASGSSNAGNPSIGALPLISVQGKDPDPSGQWTLRYPDEWGTYTVACFPSLLPCTIHGDVFLAPHVQHIDTNHKNCPINDETFDLNYAAPGSVVADPTGSAGRLLMVYEGVNACLSPVPVDIGIATSFDYGHNWPAYCGAPYNCGGTAPPAYRFYSLPTAQNPNQGPQATDGAAGSSVCRGNDCNAINPEGYGRFRVLAQEGTIPSAFVDDMSGSPYLYVIHQTASDDLSLSRIQLNGGANAFTAVENWNGTDWCVNNATYCNSTPGPILKGSTFAECGAAGQRRWQGSISYVDQTNQYLLSFVCSSSGDPATGISKGSRGAAWFWSTTSDLSAQNWSTPAQGREAQEITGSWNTFGTCDSYNGWYPTFMSLAPAAQGHLSATGYVFYTWGSLGKCSNTTQPKIPRKYASRFFTMAIN